MRKSIFLILGFVFVLTPLVIDRFIEVPDWVAYTSVAIALVFYVIHRVNCKRSFKGKSCAKDN